MSKPEWDWSRVCGIETHECRIILEEISKNLNAVAFGVVCSFIVVIVALYHFL